MFTGIVEATGRVLWLRKTSDGTQLRILLDGLKALRDLDVGDSLAVNGCCLTLTERKKEKLAFDLLEETLNKTNLRTLKQDDRVNLERPLQAESRLGGHFVQGHVDCTTEVVSAEKNGEDLRLELALPAEVAHYVAYKGSIAVNGVSLTVAEVLPSSFVVWIIPHTRHVTNIGELRPGRLVNIEFDILAKYLERMLAARPSPPNASHARQHVLPPG